MQFLKILFWTLLAFLAALFTIGNWGSVPVRLPGGMIADVQLPFLLLLAFLLGYLPLLAYHLTTRWRLRQRLATCERLLADTRAVTHIAPTSTPPAATNPTSAM